MPLPAPHARRLKAAEALGLGTVLLGAALLASAGAVTLGTRPVSMVTKPAAPAPRPSQTHTATARRTSPVTALDRNLLTAATAGDLELVQRLIAAGASAHAQDERGRTALLVAINLRHGRVARALMQAGADVNHKDRESNSAILLAAATNQVELVRLALAHGANPGDMDRYRGTALTVAAQRGNPEVVRVLLQAGVPVDHVNSLGWTALLEAIVLGDGSARYEQVVQLLLDAGADANLADRDGNTPTRHARQRGYKTMVKMLMRARGH